MIAFIFKQKSMHMYFTPLDDYFLNSMYVILQIVI